MSLLKMQALLTADESGFLLIPNVLRAWAPQVQTPIHRHRQGRRDNISAISGISVSPRRQRLGLCYLLFYDNIGQEEVCIFLRELLRHIRGPFIILLDNSCTHQGAPLEHFLDRIRLSNAPCSCCAFSGALEL